MCLLVHMSLTDMRLLLRHTQLLLASESRRKPGSTTRTFRCQVCSAAGPLTDANVLLGRPREEKLRANTGNRKAKGHCHMRTVHAHISGLGTSTPSVLIPRVDFLHLYSHKTHDDTDTFRCALTCFLPCADIIKCTKTDKLRPHQATESM